MENETHFLAAQTHITCTDEAPFPDVEQPEQEQEEEQQVNPAREKGEEKSGVNWAALAVGVIASVAAVTIATMTFGIAAPLALAAIGAAAGTIAYMAKEDVDKGSFSGVEKYIEETIKSVVVTLIVGAIVGPIAAVAGTGFLISRLLDGVAGGLSSGVDGVLFGDGIDVDNMRCSALLSVGMGSVKLAKGAGKAPRGGAYKDVPANGGEVHHMPADSVSPYSKGKGPGVRMEKEDHMKTKSWGSSKKAKAYRTKQEELIKEGKFKEAQQMDIDDVQTKFGDKYDEGIKQMEEYTEEILK
jgi:hypothetical protein